MDANERPQILFYLNLNDRTVKDLTSLSTTPVKSSYFSQIAEHKSVCATLTFNTSGKFDMA